MTRSSRFYHDNDAELGVWIEEKGIMGSIGGFVINTSALRAISMQSEIGGIKGGDHLTIAQVNCNSLNTLSSR